MIWMISYSAVAVVYWIGASKSILDMEYEVTVLKLVTTLVFWGPIVGIIWPLAALIQVIDWSDRKVIRIGGGKARKEC